MSAAAGLGMMATGEDGDAGTPAVSVDTAVEGGTCGRVTVLYAARTATADEVDAEREAALLRLRARFQQSRDAGTTVTLGGVSVSLTTTPQAQGEIKSLKEYIEARASGTTQAIRTRRGRCIDADIPIATAKHPPGRAQVPDGNSLRAGREVAVRLKLG